MDSIKRLRILSRCAFVALALAAVQVGASPPRLNPLGREVELTVPLTDGARTLGDITLTIYADGRMELPTARLMHLLSASLSPEVLERLGSELGGVARVTPDAVAFAGVKLDYDPAKIELALDVPAQLRTTRTIAVSPQGREQVGAFEPPALFSAYLNMRGSIDYVERGADPGFGGPVLFVDAAARYKSVVLETDGTWAPKGPGTELQRHGTRFVFDDPANALRWALGDLHSVGRGLQAAPEIAGFSVFRSYSVLQPQMVARPTGRQSFRLDRPSTVEIAVNGRVIRRLRLDPGAYDLRDFPFTQGIDDVRVSIQDDAGRTEVLEFNLFTDQTQLAQGLSEFGLYAGVKAPLGLSGPSYTRDPAVTGYYRRGLTDQLTLGANLQADSHSSMAGLESITSTSLGSFGANLAASRLDGVGGGFAATLTYQKTQQGLAASSSALNLWAQATSRDFAPAAGLVRANPYASRFGGAYSRSLNQSLFAAVSLDHALGRGPVANSSNYRASVGWRPTRSVQLGAELSYQHGFALSGQDIAIRFNVMVQLGRGASTNLEYDGRERTTRLSYQAQHGERAESVQVLASLERTRDNSGVNASATYLASEAELGIDHLATFGGAGPRGDSRTVLRVGSSIAYADGAVSVGRPIQDAFAIVTAHASLKDAAVILDPVPSGFTARTTMLGTATEPGLASYSERSVTIDAPLAPMGVDLGKGAFRLFPPYRSGYRLQVGSDYSMTLIGRLLDSGGKSLSLVAGTATEDASPQREAVDLFTNREGRFGLSGLRPGRWRLLMHTEPPTSYVLEIPADTTGVARAGDISPAAVRGHT